MIQREDLVKIGQFKKSHGMKGEIGFAFTDDSFDENECPFLICELEGIFVPFRVESCRFTSDTDAHVRLKNLNSDLEVRLLVHKEVFFPIKHLKERDIQEELLTWNHFLGFTIIDEHLGKIGRIIEIDDSTLNTLFIVERGVEEILVPAVDEIITHINESTKELFVELPEGLTEL